MYDEATGELYVDGKWMNCTEEEYEDGKIDHAEDSWRD